MGLFGTIRRMFAGTSSVPLDENEAAPSFAPAEGAHIQNVTTLSGRASPSALARELFAEHPGGMPADVLSDRAEAAGVDVQVIDRALDDLLEMATVKVRRITVASLHTVDLTGLESVRTRIKGVSYWVAWSERRRHGGTEYLLVTEPENEVDSTAVAVYGVTGRKVGHLSTARAASMTPLLLKLDGDAFRVTGSGVTASSGVLWVDVPRVPKLREYSRVRPA